MKSITEYGWTAESGSMKKEQTLPKQINLSDWIEIQSTGWLTPRQPKNLNLPRDTQFFQDLYKIW
jgi:hypothetical protein